MPETSCWKKNLACKGRECVSMCKSSGAGGWTRLGVCLILAEPAGVTNALKKLSSRGKLHDNGDVCGGEEHLAHEIGK